MEVNGLQRSTTSFRRQGSSGLIWDDKFISGDLNRILKDDKSDGLMKRSQSEGGGTNMYKTAGKEAPPSFDPPSPKVSGCGFCTIFGKQDEPKKKKKRT